MSRNDDGAVTKSVRKDPDFWRELRDRFKELSAEITDSRCRLDAVWAEKPRTHGSGLWFLLEGETPKRLLNRFERLAERGAIGLGHAAGDSSRDMWLDHLRFEDVTAITSHGYAFDQGNQRIKMITIQNLCAISADCCEWQVTVALDGDSHEDRFRVNAHKASRTIATGRAQNTPKAKNGRSSSLPLKTREIPNEARCRVYKLLHADGCLDENGLLKSTEDVGSEAFFNDVFMGELHRCVLPAGIKKWNEFRTFGEAWTSGADNSKLRKRQMKSYLRKIVRDCAPHRTAILKAKSKKK